METLHNVIGGFAVALTIGNLIYCFAGVMLGTFIGVLPGVGPLVTIALLLPLTFGLPPDGALIMLAGIYYGAAYGGSTTAILVNLPGESAAAATCLDGYQMALQGRAGPALAIAAIGSLIAGCFGTLLLVTLAAPLTKLALAFGAAENFSLVVLALVAASAIAHGSMVKAIGATLLGILFGLVGLDVNSGLSRFSFGLTGLADGIEFVVLAMGLFAFTEIVRTLEERNRGTVKTAAVHGLMPSREDLRQSWKPILRGTGIGSFFGIMPGAGPTIAAFAAYALEKRVSRHPERFGRGAIEGVAAPESANNAAAQASFIPTLTLGIPGSATMALMLGALMIQGIAPGPQIVTEHPALFWGLVASMFIGNLMLVIINLPLVGLWVAMLKIPYRWLYPLVLTFSCVGLFTVNGSTMDIFFAAGFGVLGYVFFKLGCEPAPFILGFLLGPLMEENFRRALLLSRGRLEVFLEKPISLALLLLALCFVLVMVVPAIRRRKEEATAEEAA